MKKQKQAVLGVAVFLVLAAVLFAVWQANRPQPEDGAKQITVQVVHSDGAEAEFTYRTDLEYLGELLTQEGLISGTKGIVRDYPFQCAFEDECFDHKAHAWFSDEKAAEVRAKYMHPMWRDVSEMAKKVGGHGGMDFIMDLRWAFCLQNGLPLDMDVYDLAATSCLCELTETSVRNGSKPISIPDFTRGNWKNVQPWGVVNVDLKKMGLMPDKVAKDKAALNV